MGERDPLSFRRLKEKEMLRNGSGIRNVCAGGRERRSQHALSAQRREGRGGHFPSFRPTLQRDTRARARSQPIRLIQHKEEARLFYRYLSWVYDHIVNPGHWTKDMREAALEPARLNEKQRVVDVGGGTGFSTTGIVEAGVTPEYHSSGPVASPAGE